MACWRLRESRRGVVSRRPDAMPPPLRQDSTGTRVLRHRGRLTSACTRRLLDTAFTCHRHGDRELGACARGHRHCPATLTVACDLEARRRGGRARGAGAGAESFAVAKALPRGSGVDQATGAGPSAGPKRRRSRAQLPASSAANPGRSNCASSPWTARRGAFTGARCRTPRRTPASTTRCMPPPSSGVAWARAVTGRCELMLWAQQFIALEMDAMGLMGPFESSRLLVGKVPGQTSAGLGR